MFPCLKQKKKDARRHLEIGWIELSENDHPGRAEEVNDFFLLLGLLIDFFEDGFTSKQGELLPIIN